MQDVVGRRALRRLQERVQVQHVRELEPEADVEEDGVAVSRAGTTR